MALVHSVTFKSVKEMVEQIAEVYLQFDPRDPIPEWWDKFEVWTEDGEQADIQNLGDLIKRLEKIEKMKAADRPDWWKLAEKEFKKAKQVRTLTLRTEPFDNQSVLEDDEEEDAVAATQEADEPEDEEPEDEEPEVEDEEPEGEEEEPKKEESSK